MFLSDELSLEVSADMRHELNKIVIDFADDFINTLEDRKAYMKGTGPSDSSAWRNINEAPENIQNLLEDLNNHMLETGLNPASGGNMGYVPGGGIYCSALGDYLAAATNPYAGNIYASPATVEIEGSLINWTGKLIGYKPGFGGNITSGGSMANLIAIATARNQKRINSTNVRRSVIYYSSLTHHSINKAIKFLGLEECVLRNIEVDKNFKFSVTALETQTRADIEKGLIPFMVVANAGATDTGTIDPLKVIHDICIKFNMWLHIDAAYGGFFMLTDVGKDKLEGLSNADSVVLDPHKSLLLPHDSCIVLVKKVEHLIEANGNSANYLQNSLTPDKYSPANFSPEMSKHYRGLSMWFPLKLYGTAVFSEYLREKIQLAYYLYEELKLIGYHVLCEPDLSVVIFRYETKNDKGSDIINQSILNYILEDGRVFISSTILQGKFTLRAAVLSFRTHKKEVDILISLLQRMMNFLEGSHK